MSGLHSFAKEESTTNQLLSSRIFGKWQEIKEKSKEFSGCSLLFN
jgi:hypothetical protein